MKELQLRTKAAKDERRNSIDSRHSYLFSMVGIALGKSEEQVTDIAIADDRWGCIDDFFKVGGAKKLMWYYQEPKPGDFLSGQSVKDNQSVAFHKEPGKKLFLTTGHEEALRGKAFFFLRLANDKAITVRNINDVLFNQLDATRPGGALQAVSDFMKQYMLPHLRRQSNWGQLSLVGRAGQNKVNQFLESVDRFNQSLDSAQVSIAGAFQLEEIDIGYNLDVALEENGIASAVGNSDFVVKLEELMNVWCKQIELVLTKSEQMRKEADDIGPSAELDHWKQRMTKFNSLLCAISARRVKLVHATLAENKSKLIVTWAELDRRVSDAANEARDNVKYLSTLDQYLGPLQTSDPVAMKELLPNLINSIRMIHTISRYYNTSERMTSLFVKVTNQMIKSCRAYIMQGSSGKVWDQDENDLLQRIQGCIGLKTEYQDQFRKARDKLAAEAESLPGNEKRHFDFSENYIFGKLENFCSRLESIKKIIVTLRVFNSLHVLRVDGIDEIVKRLEAVESNIKMRSGELDYRLTDWDNGFDEFQNAIGRLETELQLFIKSWIEKPVPTTQVFNILSKFQPLSTEINLNIMESYQELIRRYHKQDLDHVRKVYNKQKSDPPGPRNFPPVSARISWSRQLFRRIDAPMQLIRVLHDDHQILKGKDGQQAVKAYNAIATALIEYETMYHNLWTKSANQAKQGLKGSLLLRAGQEKDYIINFNNDIYQICREGRFIKKIELEVPAAADELLIQEDRLREYHKALQTLIEKFRSTRDMITPVMAPFLRFFVTRMENALRPGNALLTWDSLNVPNFIAESNAVVDEVRALFIQIQDILDCRIEATLKQIEQTEMIILPEEPVRCDQFQEMTKTCVTKAVAVFLQASSNAESYVMELISLLESNYKKEELDKLKHAARAEHNPVWYYNLTAFFCQRNTEAFVKSTRSSLDALKRRLQQSTHHYGSIDSGDDAKVPLIISDITLAIPQVVFNPSLDEIQQTINKVSDQVLTAGKSVKLWNHFELVKQHQGMYLIFVKYRMYQLI